MTNRTKFSLHEPTIKDLKATLIRTESKHRHSIESQNRLELESMTAKILFVGSSNVGKSSIINKFLFDFFPEAHNSGLEEHYKKVIRYKKRTIDLNLIDTGGLVTSPHSLSASNQLQLGRLFVVVPSKIQFWCERICICLFCRR